MRREFSAISAFSAVIAFVAGIVLCLQVANAVGALSTQAPGGTASLPRPEELPAATSRWIG